jgi:hypothetical protein
MRNKFVKSILVIFISIAGYDTLAQSFIGLSVNYGDKLMFTPNYPDLLLQRRSFTPTLVYAYQKKFQSDFSLIIGGQAGIAGYQLIPVLRDTLDSSVPSGDRTPFVDYGIFVSRLELTPGKTFQIGKRELFVGIGGGISYYRVFPFTTMSISIRHQGTRVRVFDSYIESPEAGVFAGFGKVYMQTELSKRLDIAFQYSMHWRSILNGEFEFYHTRTPAAGSIKLIPQGVSLMLLYRLQKMN